MYLATAPLIEEGEGEVCSQTGYQTVSPAQLAGVLGAYLEGGLTLRSVRVYFAALEMKAVRDAARRSRPKRGERRCRYRLDEAVRLTDTLDERAVSREVRRLRKAAVLSLTEDSITLGEAGEGRGAALLPQVACGRSFRRPIPVPRPVLRFLARNTRKALTLTVIAYLLRGLSLERKTGALKGKGTLKVSWVGRLFGLSERAIRYARADLIRRGWISKDEGSYQRKLNRDGAYFELNLGWGRGERRPKPPAPLLQARAGFAPRVVKKEGRFAPPKERPLNYFVSKNHKTSGAPGHPAGVSTKPGEGKPSLRDVKPQDLENFSRTEALYREAVKVGMVRESEASLLNWVAAAIRAKSTQARDPVKLFMGIVRKNLWDHVTQAEEDRARKAIIWYRGAVAPAGSYREAAWPAGPKRSDPV